MSEIRLKKQISELRSSLFDKKSNDDNKDLTPANINSKEKSKGTGIFNDVRSMDTRLAKLEETFYNYAYDSTKILTSFHRNTKILEKLINEITEKNEISSKTIKKIERQLPHTCPLVPKGGNAIVKKRKDLIKTFIYYLGILLLLALAVFISNIVYEIIYFKLKP
jgi:chromosome segregation ATPase